MSELNHFALSSILHSEIVGQRKFGHGQIGSLRDAQRYFDNIGIEESPAIVHKDEQIDARSVAKAFLAVRKARNDRGSADLYVADPSRNADFLQTCRQRGIHGSAYRLNKSLLLARKNGLLPGLRSVRTSIDYSKQAFASEFAATELRYRYGASIDDVLCDPKLVKEFDSIASKITPGLTPFEYRWAILSIRKAGRLSDLPKSFKMPPFKRHFRLVEDPISDVPDASGIYLLYEREHLLYTRSTERLRTSVEIHRNPTVLEAITQKLWRPKLENFIVDFAIIPERKSYLLAIERQVVETLRPVFNVARTAA